MRKKNELLSLFALLCIFYISYQYNATTVKNLHSKHQNHKLHHAQSTSGTPQSSSSSSTSSKTTILTEYTPNGQLPPKNIPLPLFFDNLADITDTTNPNDIPFFWHIARGGGSTVKDIMGGCLELTQASDVGARNHHDLDTELKVLRINGGKYLNIDSTTPDGIERAKRMNAIQSGLLDVVVSPRFIAASTLFSPTKRRGKVFAMFRDPIERATSMFYYLGFADWEKTYDPNLLIYEIHDYAKTARIENNWMVRSLVDKMEEGYLSYEDLELAKEVLRRKCLVGLMKEKEESMKRFEVFFGWEGRAKLPGASECRERLLDWGWSNKHRHPNFEPGSESYNLLKTKNELDIELYEYAKILFDQQGIALGLSGDDHDKTNEAFSSEQDDDMAIEETDT